MEETNMAQKANIAPLQYAPPLGPHPVLYGTGEPNYFVDVAVSNTGQVLGKGRVESGGQWRVELTIKTGEWIQVQARCYATPNAPVSNVEWSDPVNIYG